jgi:hypothetical protein
MFKKWEFVLFTLMIFGLGFLAGLYWDVGVVQAEMEVSANVGYHAWTNSGETFAHTNVSDKEFNRLCVKAEGTYWWDWFGVYGYIGMDDDVKEEIRPGKDYENECWYSGVGVKGRTDLGEKWKGYLGGGINYTYLDNWYGGRHIETFDDEFGYDLVTGVNYYFVPDWFLSINGQYTWNKMWSDVQHRTSWNPDGLRAWCGVGKVF